MIRRWMFNLASLASAILCIAVAMLWVRSYSQGFNAIWRGHDRGVEFFTCTGRLCITLDHILRHDQYSFEGFRFGPLIPDIPWDTAINNQSFHLGSIAWGWGANPAISGWMLILPYWLFVVLLLILPLLWLRRSLRPAPVPHACENCGYNLTGNTSGVCPECGTVVSRSSSCVCG